MSTERIDWKQENFVYVKETMIEAINVLKRIVMGERVSFYKHLYNFLKNKNPEKFSNLKMTQIHGFVHVGQQNQGIFYKLGLDARVNTWNEKTETEALEQLEYIKNLIENVKNYEEGIVLGRKIRKQLEDRSLGRPSEEEPEEEPEEEEPEEDPQTFAQDSYNRRQKEIFKRIKGLLEDKKNLIVTGVPGTGKTYFVRKFVESEFKPENTLFIQFHPSYSYEEFIEGFRPGKTEVFSFNIEPGIFKLFLNKIQEDRIKNDKEKYVIIIDEINRGNVPKIFGELLFGIEYREIEIPTIYSKDAIEIPDSLYIIGTMNTADRNLALVDFALRRRFRFLEFTPDFELLKDWLIMNGTEEDLANSLMELMISINIKLTKFFGKEYQLGHTYFLIPKIDLSKTFRIWINEIIPMLEELCLGDQEQLKNILIETNLYERSPDSERLDFRISFETFKRGLSGVSNGYDNT